MDPYRSVSARPPPHPTSSATRCHAHYSGHDDHRSPIPINQTRLTLLPCASQTHFWAVRDYLAPVLRDSKFKESGRITPEEFVAAGDFLVYKFPTWQWEAGDPTKRRDFLPADKQYLVSRNGQPRACFPFASINVAADRATDRAVPCLRRVSQLAYGGGGDEDAETMMSFALDGANDGEGEDWVATHTSKGEHDPALTFAGCESLAPTLFSNACFLLQTHLHLLPRLPLATSLTPTLPVSVASCTFGPHRNGTSACESCKGPGTWEIQICYMTESS